jgi:hypothetical protein
MGFKEFFFGAKDPEGRPKKIVKAEQKVTNMFLQPADRQYFLDQLRLDGSEAAARVLLKRFTSQCENLTVDRDEKEMTCHFLVSMGANALGPLQDYLRRHDEHVNWPIAALRELMPPDDFKGFIAELLERVGPDYVRHPERKEQLMLAAKDLPDEPITRALLPYLTDHNETIRFLAADALITHASPLALTPLIEAIFEEESQRVIIRALEGIAAHGWSVPADLIEPLRPKLPYPFSLTPDGKLHKP